MSSLDGHTMMLSYEISNKYIFMTFQRSEVFRQHLFSNDYFKMSLGYWFGNTKLLTSPK